MGFEGLFVFAGFGVPDFDGFVGGLGGGGVSIGEGEGEERGEGEGGGVQQLASHLPSGENLTAETPSLCPVKVYWTL